MKKDTYCVEKLILEAELIEGIKEHVIEELKQYQGINIHLSQKNFVQFTFSGNIKDLLKLRTVNALYQVLTFDVTRPKALLGHQNFHTLLDAINHIQSLNNPFKTIYIDAAGSNSSVMIRLKNELASALDLAPIDEKGDLLLRIRRSKNGTGWDVLIRLTDRPLATRDWRICNYEGALNATVAAVMAQWIDYKPHDNVLNLMCGSGSIMIEFLERYPDAQIIGVDNNPIAIECALANIEAVNLHQQIHLVCADVRNLSLLPHSFDLILADLPFGQLIGSHDENKQLYPLILQGTAHITKKEGKFLLVTHEIKLMEKLLDQFANIWQKTEELRINLNGLHPRLYLLEKQ